MSDGKGYPIPDPIDPIALKCIRIYVPDDPLYLGAFWQAYSYFGQWTAWTRDAAHSGATAAAVWRAAIDLARTEYEAGEGCDVVNFRVNEDCKLEVECEGEWIPVVTPGTYDPRTDDQPAIPYPDPVPGQERECLAAANATQAVKASADKISDSLANAGFFGTLLAAIMEIFTVILTTALDIIYETVFEVLALLDPNTVRADYLAFDWQDLTDVIVCYYSPDGTMTQENYIALLNDLAARVSGGSQMWVIAHWFVLTSGRKGMQRAARFANINSAVCAECIEEWEHIQDFTVGLGMYEVYPIPAGDIGGQYLAGQGIAQDRPTSGDEGWAFRVHWNTNGHVNYAKLEVVPNWDGDAAPTLYFEDWDRSNSHGSWVVSGTEWETDTDFTSEGVLFIFDPSGAGGQRDTTTVCWRVTLRGTGANPFLA